MRRYSTELVRTELSVGHAAMTEEDAPSIEERAERLLSTPLDDYQHQALAREFAALDDAAARAFLTAHAEHKPVLAACLVAVLAGAQPELTDWFGPADIARLKEATPLADLRVACREDTGLQRAWMARIAPNMLQNDAVGDVSGLASPVPPEALEAARSALAAPVALTALPEYQRGKNGPTLANEGRAPLEEIIGRALAALTRMGAEPGPERRHLSSLSPVGLLRTWKLRMATSAGRHEHELTGSLTSYGRGLELARARAGLLMEMVERVSAHASYDKAGVTRRRTPLPMERGSYAELAAAGRPVMDPNTLRLEVDYEDQVLYWLPGTSPDGFFFERQVLVPAQCVTMFCNLDEVSLYSSLGSTGLGAGGTMAEARRQALLEIIERDAEAVTPFSWSQCFRPVSRHEATASLLAGYTEAGAHLAVRELTTEFGVPVYQAFVTLTDGTVLRGAGAALSGPAACLSAITEVPCAYPDTPDCRELPELPERVVEELPHYATGRPDADLELLEAALAAKGLRPVYVDLTREDANLPVVRAVVPGLEIMADFDRFARVSPRWLARFEQLVTR